MDSICEQKACFQIKAPQNPLYCENHEKVRLARAIKLNNQLESFGRAFVRLFGVGLIACLFYFAGPVVALLVLILLCVFGILISVE